MKRLAPLLVCLLLVATSYAQVGINTSNPTSTLDVNGNIRVRTLNVEDIQAIKIIGVDAAGNMVEVEPDENIVLEDNRLRALQKKERISDPFPLVSIINHNINFIILPGEPNDDKSVIRLTSLLGDVVLTGMAPGEDGQTIWLYPTSGQLTILPNSILSLLGNQILSNDNNPIIVDRYRMIELMYDATLSKWIVKSKPQ